MSPTRAGALAGERRIGPARRIAVDVRGSVALTGLLLKYLSFSALMPAAFPPITARRRICDQSVCPCELVVARRDVRG